MGISENVKLRILQFKEKYLEINSQGVNSVFENM
mgnify:CR=1 FL=1